MAYNQAILLVSLVSIVSLVPITPLIPYNIFMIILLASEKGGVGKSTIATNLAGGYASSGQSVIILDADPQGTSYQWAQDRKAEALPPIAIQKAKGQISNKLVSLSKQYDMVITDTPGRNSAEMQSALRVANIAILPLRPSQPDLDTISTVAGNIEKASKVNRKLKAYILLTMASTHPLNNEKKVAAAIIKDFKSIGLAKTIICGRKGYRDAISEGKTVMEINAGKASLEIIKLGKEINKW